MTAAKVASITSLEELEGYEQQARLRGYESDELAAISAKRAELKRRGRK